MEWRKHQKNMLEQLNFYYLKLKLDWKTVWVGEHQKKYDRENEATFDSDVDSCKTKFCTLFFQQGESNWRDYFPRGRYVLLTARGNFNLQTGYSLDRRCLLLHFVPSGYNTGSIVLSVHFFIVILRGCRTMQLFTSIKLYSTIHSIFITKRKKINVEQFLGPSGTPEIRYVKK